MEEKRVDFKKTVMAFVFAVIAILLICCLVKISEANNKIEELHDRLSRRENEIENLQREIDAVYANVDEKLKKEASLLSGVEYDIVAFHTDGASASLRFSVVPKAITEDMKVKIAIDGKTVELVKNETAFVGTMAVGIFLSDVRYPLLTIETEEGIQTEYLEDIRISHLFERFLPELHTSMSGKSSYSNGKLTTDFSLSINSKARRDDIDFTSFILVEEIDGKELHREAITAADRDFMTYKKTFEIAEGETLSFYVLAEDSLGYVHKTKVWGWYQDKDGNTAESVMHLEHIYDQNGNLLFPINSTLYE